MADRAVAGGPLWSICWAPKHIGGNVGRALSRVLCVFSRTETIYKKCHPPFPFRQRRERRDQSRRSAESRTRGLIIAFGLILSLLVAAAILMVAFSWASFTRDLPTVAALPVLLDPQNGALLQPTRLYDRSGGHVISPFRSTSALYPQQFPAVGRRHARVAARPRRPAGFRPAAVASRLPRRDLRQRLLLRRSASSDETSSSSGISTAPILATSPMARTLPPVFILACLLMNSTLPRPSPWQLSPRACPQSLRLAAGRAANQSQLLDEMVEQGSFRMSRRNKSWK
jgi:hypothetical protein